jgi:hypothetical protein
MRSTPQAFQPCLGRTGTLWLGTKLTVSCQRQLTNEGLRLIRRRFSAHFYDSTLSYTRILFLTLQTTRESSLLLATSSVCRGPTAYGL